MTLLWHMPPTRYQVKYFCKSYKLVDLPRHIAYSCVKNGEADPWIDGQCIGRWYVNADGDYVESLAWHVWLEEQRSLMLEPA